MNKKDKIQIVSWLLTRRCNLKCSYCALVKNYKGKPEEYPDMKYYHQNEMTTEYIIAVLKKLKEHNPNCFSIFYGGEPTLRSDLPEIINFCNKEEIPYTIITNNSDEVQPMIENLIMKTDRIMGLTSSVDPLVIGSDPNSDRYKKCIKGFEKLIELKGLIDDVVAEITVDGPNIPYLYNLVKTISGFGINSDITFLDIAKTPYYDFSNVTDEKDLVHRTLEVEETIQKIIDDDTLDVHMKKTLLPALLQTLPANIDCELEKDVHNMTIDADGSLRLCLRVRGISTPKLSAYNAFTNVGKLNPIVKEMITKDKASYCRGCQWSCVEMSKILSKGKDTTDELLHSDRRK